jgi:hypothetical protein
VCVRVHVCMNVCVCVYLVAALERGKPDRPFPVLVTKPDIRTWRGREMS